MIEIIGFQGDHLGFVTMHVALTDFLGHMDQFFQPSLYTLYVISNL